jgi:hypothetical protein
VLVISVLLFCPTLGSRVCRGPTMRIDGLSTCQSVPSVVEFQSSQPLRHRNVSHFSQFRYRMKSVLGETTDPTAEEFDLGPAVIPSRLISVSPLELTSRRYRTVHPLRC